MDSLGLRKASSHEEKIGPNSSKASNVKKHYEKLGSAGIKGSLYQIDLLMMVLLNGLRKVENWRLSTEDKAAAQLDDLIFEHLPSESAILLQAKHKEDVRQEVTYKDLMSVNKKNLEFSLPKYFFSYQQVKSKFNVQNVLICTNLKLDKKTRSILKEESVDPESVLHFEGAENICYGFSGCSFPELKQNIKTYHAKTIKRKKVIISDDDINDYLNHLKFFGFGDENVDKIIQETLSQMKFSENLHIKMVQRDIHKKMTDWFKEKKGRYLTEVEAKAFFCDIQSNKYCEDLKLYDISFKNNNLPLILQPQQKNEKKGKKTRKQNASNAPVKAPKRVSHIIPDKEYVLNVVKIYQALPTHHSEKTLFVNPDETVEGQRQIIDSFAVQHYTILVMACPNTIEETIAKEMCGRVMEILDTYKYKHVILIAEERNSLAAQLKQANINYYEVITDKITFADLEETTQEGFKRKKIIHFQGCTVSLEELFASPTEGDLNEIANSEILFKLARGARIQVGLELPRPDNYYISRSFNLNEKNISEGDLWRSAEVGGERIILISDSTGMGKSSVLTSLAVSIKRDNPGLWVVRFDLNNHTHFMEKTLKEGRTSVSIIEMLNSQETSRLKSGFDMKLFTTPNRIVLMLDGVDEVSPTYTELVVNLIRYSLAQVNVAKIFVTTRPHLSKDLEEIPELQSFPLEPFSEGNQVEFLTKYWTENLDLPDAMRKNRCKIYAKALTRKISMWINEEDRNSFAGMPLQTRMLAEIFQEGNQTCDDPQDWEGCKEFSSSNNEEPKLPMRIDLTQVYAMFIDKKCDIFIKKSNPSRYVPADELLKNQFEKCQELHRAIALKVIFESDKWNLFTCCTNINRPISISSTPEYNDLLRIGIVQETGENMNFIHRTFAEYLVAGCLLTELERKPARKVFQQFFVNSIMRQEQFYLIRMFFDSLMRNVSHLIENNFCAHFRINQVSQAQIPRYIAVFAEEGCARILNCFIKCIDKEQQKILSKTVNNIHLMRDVLSSAIQNGHLNVLKLLLKLNDTFNKGNVAHRAFLQEAIIAAGGNNLEMVKFLVGEHGVDVNAKNVRGCTAFLEAASNGNLEVVEFLVETAGADLTITDNDGWTALHRAAFWSKLEVVKFLVEKAGAHINIKDKHGWTALHQAVFMGRFEIVKFLVEKTKAHIDVKDSVATTILHTASLMGRFEVVKFLVENAGADINIKDDDGMAALHKAALKGSLQVIRFLVEDTRADINIKDNSGSTALHIAAFWGKLEVVKFLVEKPETDINIKDNAGRTALHKASYEGELETVKFLVEAAGADINIQDNFGSTALHRAAFWGNLEVVKFLVEIARPDVTIKNNQGRTALQVAGDQRHWKDLSRAKRTTPGRHRDRVRQRTMEIAFSTLHLEQESETMDPIVTSKQNADAESGQCSLSTTVLKV